MKGAAQFFSPGMARTDPRGVAVLVGFTVPQMPIP